MWSANPTWGHFGSALANLESDIQHWLKKSLSLDQISDLVCKAMLKDLKAKKTTSFSSGFTFLLRSGHKNQLFNFVFEHLWTDPTQWPWAHLLEAVLTSDPEVQFKAMPWLVTGAAEFKKTSELAKNHVHHETLEPLGISRWRAERMNQRKEEINKNKKKLLDHFFTFRSQQLYEPEKKLLYRLELMFPSDPEIRALLLEHKKRYALDILQLRLRAKRDPLETLSQNLSEEDQEWVQAAKDAHLKIGTDNPELKKDLLVSALLLDLPGTAYELLDQIPAREDLTWLVLEVLLAAGRYAELLDALGPIEVEKSSEAETFFATAYFRAQALYGLGQKQKAIEVMEGLVASRPDYRSANTLLTFWRTP